MELEVCGSVSTWRTARGQDACASLLGVLKPLSCNRQHFPTSRSFSTEIVQQRRNSAAMYRKNTEWYYIQRDPYARPSLWRSCLEDHVGSGNGTSCKRRMKQTRVLAVLASNTGSVDAMVRISRRRQPGWHIPKIIAILLSGTQDASSSAVFVLPFFRSLLVRVQRNDRGSQTTHVKPINTASAPPMKHSSRSH